MADKEMACGGTSKEQDQQTTRKPQQQQQQQEQQQQQQSSQTTGPVQREVPPPARPLGPADRVLKARDIRSRTVILNMDTRGKPYNRFDVAEALLESNVFSSPDEICCLGPLSRNAEWYITLRTEDLKRSLLNLGSLCVGRYSGSFRPAGCDEYKLRVHWLPPWVDNQSLASSLHDHGLDVLSIATDNSTVTVGQHTFKNTQITVRSVTVRTDTKSSIPHMLDVEDFGFGESLKALVTMAGRAPLCLRCQREGHIRARCDTPFCTLCKSFGHKNVDCTGHSSYAGALRAQDPDPQEDMDAEMEERVVGAEGSSSENDGSADLIIDIPKDGKRKLILNSNDKKNTKPQVEKKIKASHVITPARPITNIAASPVYTPRTKTKSQTVVTHIPETPSSDWADEVDANPPTPSEKGWVSPKSQKEKREDRFKKKQDPRSYSKGKIPVMKNI